MITNESFTSSELETALAELRTRRTEMATETAKAKTELDDARSGIRFYKPKTVETATLAQAKHTVLESATAALDEEIAQTEANLEATLAHEQRQRDLAQVAELQASLDTGRTALESKSLEVAQSVEAQLRGLTNDMRASWETSTKLHFLRANLGLVQGPLDTILPFNEGNMEATLNRNGVNISVVRGLMDALQQLRFGDFVQSGLPLTRESVAYRIVAEEHAMPPQPFAGGFTINTPEMLTKTEKAS